MFLKRYRQHLSPEQEALVQGWERDLCVSETALVEKFLTTLQQRKAELQALRATCAEELFSGHGKKADDDFRFGYDFLRRTWCHLSLVDQERVRRALQPLLIEVEHMPLKAARQ